MNSNSQETLRRVTQNDPSLTELSLVGYNTNFYDSDGKFYSDNRGDYSALGAAIANNTHLEKLEVILSDDLPLPVLNRGFYDGLKANSSISNVQLYCNSHNITRNSTGNTKEYTALPYIVNWFESAREAIANGVEEYNVEGRKLSAIFQFGKAMPLLLEGISHMNVDNKKRKRED